MGKPTKSGLHCPRKAPTNSGLNKLTQPTKWDDEDGDQDEEEEGGTVTVTVTVTVRIRMRMRIMMVVISGHAPVSDTCHLWTISSEIRYEVFFSVSRHPAVKQNLAAGHSGWALTLEDFGASNLWRLPSTSRSLHHGSPNALATTGVKFYPGAWGGQKSWFEKRKNSRKITISGFLVVIFSG